MNRLTKKSEGRVFQPQDVALAALILKLSQPMGESLELPQGRFPRNQRFLGLFRKHLKSV